MFHHGFPPPHLLPVLPSLPPQEAPHSASTEEVFLKLAFLHISVAPCCLYDSVQTWWSPVKQPLPSLPRRTPSPHSPLTFVDAFLPPWHTSANHLSPRHPPGLSSQISLPAKLCTTPKAGLSQYTLFPSRTLESRVTDFLISPPHRSSCRAGTGILSVLANDWQTGMLIK